MQMRCSAQAASFSFSSKERHESSEQTVPARADGDEKYRDRAFEAESTRRKRRSPELSATMMPRRTTLPDVHDPRSHHAIRPTQAKDVRDAQKCHSIKTLSKQTVRMLFAQTSRGDQTSEGLRKSGETQTKRRFRCATHLWRKILTLRVQGARRLFMICTIEAAPDARNAQRCGKPVQRIEESEAVINGAHHESLRASRMQRSISYM